MLRDVQPEILDELDAADPRAIHSRRDLQRVNALMGHPRMIAQALPDALGGACVVELGAGDGTFLLNVAKRIGKQSNVRAVLVDQRPSVSAETQAGFASAGWQIEIAEADVFEWLRRPQHVRTDVTVANLFLHHFREPELARLLQGASEQTKRFVACEPLRSTASVIGASLLRFVGCNGVTMHDARASVHAGFRDRELSNLWPADGRWHLSEQRSGRFTHMFVADHAA
ncbi:MAG TPA: methyltransferase domain-containing protein [Vicinamibacterales bacterium]|nr:methyltransferase domain-containing protein [Vicinamibacterales bacterium]